MSHAKNDDELQIQMDCQREGCGYHGMLYPVDIGGGQTVLYCQACMEAHEQQVAEMESEATAGRLQEAYRKMSDVPNKFAEARLDDFLIDPSLVKRDDQFKKAHIKAMRETRDLVLRFYEAVVSGMSEQAVFWGPNGTGKSLMACAIVNELIEEGYRARFYYARPLIYQAMDVGEYNHLIDSVADNDLTVIDDLSEISSTEHTRGTMMDIIERIVGGEKSLIITTNRDNYSTIKKVIGDGGYDRIQLSSNGGTIDFKWPSFRGVEVQST